MSAAPPRVLHLVWNLIRGGTEGQCARVAMALREAGLDHRVGVFRREGFFMGPVEERCGPVYHLPVERIASLRTLALLRGFASHLRRERFDLLHAWDADAEIFGSWAARWAGLPWLTSRRDLGEIYAGWKLHLMKQADRGARAVVVNASAIGRRVEAAGVPASRIALIPNILDVEEFDRLAARPFPRASELGPGRWIGLVARLDPEKDVATFLRAAARIAGQIPDARFVVAGDGVQRHELERLRAELSMDDRVVLLGEVTDVPALLGRLSVGVLCPKANEGLSNSILEYMAARLPVVATHCGGNADLVREGETGFVVRPGDVAGLAEALVALLRDPARARTMGEAGRLTVEQRHCPAIVAAQFADLYAHAVTP